MPGVPLWRLPDGTDSDVCPAQLVRADHADLLRLYALFQRGVFPLPGALFEQSAFYVDAMMVIDKYVGKERTAARRVRYG